MGLREWWLAHSLWRLDVVSGFYKLEEMLLCVNYLLLKLFTVLMSRQDAAVAVGMFL
jgi:hypothetical protein